MRKVNLDEFVLKSIQEKPGLTDDEITNVVNDAMSNPDLKPFVKDTCKDGEMAMLPCNVIKRLANSGKISIEKDGKGELRHYYPGTEKRNSIEWEQGI